MCEANLKNIFIDIAFIEIKQTSTVVPSEPVTTSTPQPTEGNTTQPTKDNTTQPTQGNTTQPTQVSTPQPTQVGTPQPTQVSTPQPTQVSTPQPTQVSTPQPTQVSTPQPTQVSTPQPTQDSTNEPFPPSKVQGVTVTKTGQGHQAALRVSWSAVSGSGITYTVCYSTTSGTQSDPPSNADCGTSGITGTCTTLGPLSRGTTYYIWVAAMSSGVQGLYSDRRQSITCNGIIV